MDRQKLPSKIENEFIDSLWSRIEELDHDKIFEEAKRIASFQRRLRQLPNRNATLEKQLDQMKRESAELNQLIDLLKVNNDRFLESWDINDPLFGAYSANEFIDFDFLDVLAQEIKEPDNKTLVREMTQEVRSIESWLDKVEHPKRIPPNRKGNLLKRLKSLDPDDLSPYHLRRKEILNEIKVNFVDVFYPNERIERYAANHRDRIDGVMTYFFDYIKYRIDHNLPWAICGQFIGFVACPPTYRTLVFNTQDGYFNAEHLTGVFSDKTIRDFFDTLEGKMLFLSFSERYTHNKKGIPGAYHLAKPIAKMFSDSFVWKNLPGISYDTFRGIYIHPELMESFASYLGEKTYNWVMPNLRYLRTNPARHMSGDSWFIATAGTVPPNFPIRIKPLKKHLIFWLREDEDPFHIHVSFGDKFYLARILKDRDVKLVVEFFGILDEDYHLVESTLDRNAKRKKYKTWQFKDWIDVKISVTEIYINIDRAYYGYDDLHNQKIQLMKEIIFTREEPRRFNDGRVYQDIPETVQRQAGFLSNDDLFGNINDYIVHDDEIDESVRKEFFDDYDRSVRYKFKTHRVVSGDAKPVEYKEIVFEGYFKDIEWKDNAREPSVCPPPDASSRQSSRGASSRGASSRASTLEAVASEFGDPLLFRERRKLLLRAAVVSYLVKEYNETHAKFKSDLNNPMIPVDKRIELLRQYQKKYANKDHEREFYLKIVRAFYNTEDIDLIESIRKGFPIDDVPIDVVGIDEDLTDEFPGEIPGDA